MHTPIHSLLERFCEESTAVQNKYGHLLEIISQNDTLDTELYEMKVGHYQSELRIELAELIEKYNRIAHKDSLADREKLKEQLINLQETHCSGFIARYDAKNMGSEEVVSE